MKIRQGFVSNSSSSSFIAVLDKKGGFSALFVEELRLFRSARQMVVLPVPISPVIWINPLRDSIP